MCMEAQAVKIESRVHTAPPRGESQEVRSCTSERAGGRTRILPGLLLPCERGFQGKLWPCMKVRVRCQAADARCPPRSRRMQLLIALVEQYMALDIVDGATVI